MDDTDRQLLGLLRHNARTSIASLAKALKVSRGTVQNRLRRLESEGTITGLHQETAAAGRGAPHSCVDDHCRRGQSNRGGSQGTAR